MTKLFQLKPVKRFRTARNKACGNCKHLIEEDYGLTIKCRRPTRSRNGKRPYWRHHSGNYAEEVYASIWTHICDRWTKKPS